MNALYVLNDQTLFETESSTRVVMREHARQIGILHILSPGNAKKIEHEDLGDGKALVIHSMGYSRSLLFYNLKRRIRKLIKKENIEIVSAQDPFEYGWMAMKAVKGTSAKLHINVQTDVLSPWFIRGNITRISHMRMPLSNRLRRMVVDRILLQADGIRVPSLRVANSLSARYGKKIVLPTIMPPQTSGHLKESITISARAFTFTLLTVGPLEPDKRIQDILHALAYAHRLYPSVGLVIVGEGSEMKNIQEKVVRLGLTQNVLFMGNQIDPIGLMQSADVLCSCMRHWLAPLLSQPM
jgi:glycosyltransferase involved in cell wall biosynthesis